jgi:DNA-binding transcriptional MerR regulator
LHRIVALRGFGFSLSEIGRLLDSAAPDPRAVIRSQLDQAQDRARQAARLRDRLAVVLELFDAAGDPSAATLVHLIEELVGMENSYTAEEFERMAAHRRELMAQLAPEQLEQMSAHRAALRAGLTPEQLAELQRSRPPMPR